jgi:hypothetical protein
MNRYFITHGGLLIMKNIFTLGICMLAFLTVAIPVHAVIVANSAAEFSDIQGQGNWYYGIFYQTAPAGDPHGYSADLFQFFDDYNGLANRWMASDSLVGANNNRFLSLWSDGGHPTGIGPGGQDAIIWAVRRYVSEVDGLINISFDLRKSNTEEPRGGGITGRIFVDGIEVLTQFIENSDGVGVRGIIQRKVSVGSVIDFAIDPTGQKPLTGTDGQFSARADGTIFSATISDSTTPVIIPSLLLLF